MVVRTRHRKRIEALTAEAVREVGVLLVAFAPLDMAFGEPSAKSTITGLPFLLLGLLLFGIGLLLERRRDKA